MSESGKRGEERRDSAARQKGTKSVAFSRSLTSLAAAAARSNGRPTRFKELSGTMNETGLQGGEYVCLDYLQCARAAEARHLPFLKQSVQPRAVGAGCSGVKFGGG